MPLHCGDGRGETRLWVGVIAKVNFLDFCEPITYFTQHMRGIVWPTGDDRTVSVREVYFFGGCCPSLVSVEGSALIFRCLVLVILGDFVWCGPWVYASGVTLKQVIMIPSSSQHLV